MPKKIVPVFLPLFVDGEGKKTFMPFRVENQEQTDNDGKVQKIVTPVKNSQAKDKTGSPLFKPMNRAARRQQDSILRRKT